MRQLLQYILVCQPVAKILKCQLAQDMKYVYMCVWGEK